MAAGRKLVAVLLLGAVASSTAFKPSNAAARRTTYSSDEAISLSKDEAPVHVLTSSRDVSRGGDCDVEGLLHIHKADVVKYHGIFSIMFAAVFLLETIGIQVPIIGTTAIFPGFDGSNGTTKFIMRFLAAVTVGLGLYEIEYASSSTAQEIFTKYHILCSALTLWTMKELGGKGMHWLCPGMVTLFLIGSLVAK